MLAIGSLAAFLAYFVKGLSGFANTPVFQSVLGLRLASRAITPVDLLLGLPANAYMAWSERRSLSLKKSLPIIATLLVGIVPGALVLRGGDDRVLKIFLGFAIIALAAEMFLRERGTGKRAQKPWLMLLIGVGSGFLCGLFGVGAFLVAYISRTTDDMAEMRGTLCCVFVADNLLRIALYLRMGLLGPDALRLALVLLPATALGIGCGIFARRFFREKTVRYIVMVLLAAMGVWTILNNALL